MRPNSLRHTEIQNSIDFFLATPLITHAKSNQIVIKTINPLNREARYAT